MGRFIYLGYTDLNKEARAGAPCKVARRGCMGAGGRAGVVCNELRAAPARACVLDHVGIILGPFSDHFEIILGSF